MFEKPVRVGVVLVTNSIEPELVTVPPVVLTTTL